MFVKREIELGVVIKYLFLKGILPSPTYYTLTVTVAKIFYQLLEYPLNSTDLAPRTFFVSWEICDVWRREDKLSSK